MLARVEELSRGSRAVVGLGSARQDDAAATTAERARVGGMSDLRVFSDPEALVSALMDGVVDAAVRGTLPAHEVLPLLRRASDGSNLGRAAVMDLGGGRSFLLTPVGIDEGRDLGERWAVLKEGAALVRALGFAPRAAIMAMGREEDAGRGDAIAISLRESGALRDAAEAEAIPAECVGIRVEAAVEAGNVIIAPDGVTGNLIFRCLHLVAGMGSWGAVALNLRPQVFVDTSREKDDYTGALHLARAIAGVRADR